VELQDSATCLLKGTSIVVAGDEHQMPPSQYFKVSNEHLYEEDDEEEYTGAEIEVESLLEFCQQQPRFQSRFLDFHYRSHHPYLIQFSNSAIYSRLVVRPSTLSYKPIQLLDVQGTWENQHNLDEIDEIISTLREIDVPVQQPPKVMIATFNVRQRTEIIRAIEEAKSNQAFRDHITPLEGAGLSVKNLENLQGDECDILIISIGYGRTPAGRFVRNYSLINRKNGYRLLNVLVTRARYKVIVMNSIPRQVHSQFEQELMSGTQEHWSRGLLHAYIQYAQAVSNGDEIGMNRILDILKSYSIKEGTRHLSSDEEFESPFEEEVWNILREQYDESEITLQHPARGFRIDMVVTPRSHPGLKIAVECDGETYHSGWQNQLADFHREKLLRDAGYEFVRIWSRNWWSDTPGSAKKLLNEIEEIKQGWAIKELRLPDWVSKEVEFEAKNETLVIVDRDEEVPVLSAFEQLQNWSTTQAQTSSEPRFTPNHVLAPCLVTARLLRDNDEATEIRYLFLSNRINSFRGHTRNHWQELGRLSKKMATFGEEHEVYQVFRGKEVGDTVAFRQNRFKIIDIEFDDWGW
jgi:very-short-patch-repair endonuclease